MIGELILDKALWDFERGGCCDLELLAEDFKVRVPLRQHPM